MRRWLLAASLLALTLAIQPAIALPGFISTVAGSSYGFSGDGGPATSASLSYPAGVATDSTGNLYIADVANNRVRKVDTAGVISTVAGSGTAGFSGDGGQATSASLNYPWSVAIDPSGNLYIADLYNYRIRKVNTAGVISTVAGNGTYGFSGDGGPATRASLTFVWSIATNSAGGLYIVDGYNNRVRKVNAAGVISTFAGGLFGTCGDGGQASSACLQYPHGVATDSSGSVYISDWPRVRKVDSAGVISTVAGTITPGFSGDGGPATSARLFHPYGVVIDSSGTLYIADEFNSNVRKVNAAGTISTVAGNGTAGFSGDGGLATSASVYAPQGVATDSLGNLYIGDFGNYRVRKVDTPLVGCIPSPVCVP